MTASPGIFIYKDAKLFTQHLMLGAAGSTTLTEVCIGFSSWWRDCHIQSECARLLHCLTPYSSLVLFFSGGLHGPNTSYFYKGLSCLYASRIEAHVANMHVCECCMLYSEYLSISFNWQCVNIHHYHLSLPMLMLFYDYTGIT